MNEGQLIYVADDEEHIRAALQSFLAAEGYRVMTFATGDALLQHFIEQACDLIILDVMMPGSNGFMVCSRLREISTVPIIMLTARDSDIDYAMGINLGSDDYFTKPFSAMALVMRVKAIFRRIAFEKQVQGESLENLSFGGIVINRKAKTVVYREESLELTPNEYNLLSYLMENQDKAVSRDELLNKIWGYQSEVETRAADDTVRRLRKKISHTDVVIDTVWGYGFRLQEKEKP